MLIVVIQSTFYEDFNTKLYDRKYSLLCTEGGWGVYILYGHWLHASSSIVHPLDLVSGAKLNDSALITHHLLLGDGEG